MCWYPETFYYGCYHYEYDKTVKRPCVDRLQGRLKENCKTTDPNLKTDSGNCKDCRDKEIKAKKDKEDREKMPPPPPKKVEASSSGRYRGSGTAKRGKVTKGKTR